MFPHGYEEIDHTADLALKVWGEDFHALLKQAARGLYDLLGVTIDPDNVGKHEFTIDAGQEETLLVDFLSEVLYLAEDEKLFFEDFTIVETPTGMLISGTCQVILSLAREIKAVTFHDLSVKRTKGGLETILTFDV